MSKPVNRRNIRNGSIQTAQIVIRSMRKIEFVIWEENETDCQNKLNQINKSLGVQCEQIFQGPSGY